MENNVIETIEVNEQFVGSITNEYSLFNDCSALVADEKNIPF